MALLVPSGSGTPTTHPTAALTDALQSFENVLTEEQRQNYHDNFTKPDTASVLTFITQIDADNRGRGSKCVAPRLYTFLEATQQFVGVVDTFVSSNPQIAALVWGGVKTAILAASNIASYFDKVTSMIMTIGQFCPTYRQFGQLYPSCLELQKALCEYYAIIIRLCVKIVEVSQRSGVMKLLSPIFNPFETEFKPYHDDLDQAVKYVQMQISLASKNAAKEAAQLSEIEMKKSSVHRRKVALFQKEMRNEKAEVREWQKRAAAREMLRIRSAIKDNLSSVDHTRPWKQAMRQRMQGTDDWLLHDPVFCCWKQDDKTSILWCSGNLGTGKTVLTSNVVAHLYATRKASDLISYFFCRTDIEESLLARNILGSIARQLLDGQIERSKGDLLIKLYNCSQFLDSEDIVDLLITQLELEKSYYVILDGIDDCKSMEIDTIARGLDKLRRSHAQSLKIFCTGRPGFERSLFQTVSVKYKITLAREEVNADIQNYINTTLDELLEGHRLKLNDPSLILKIADKLQRGSHGMFLWTRLLLEELCAQGSDNEIVKALESLPTELFEIYRRSMQRVSARNQAGQAIKTLQICGVAKRPLSVEELREALSVEPGQKYMDNGNLPNDMDRVLAACCGLAFVDEEDDTVHYIHQSVKEYLFGRSSEDSNSFNEADLDKYLGILCLTYLDFSDFQRQLVKKAPSAPIDPLQIAMNTMNRDGGIANKLAQQLLRRSNRFRPIAFEEFGRKAQELLGTTEESRLKSELCSRHFHFLTYAQIYWAFHLRDLNDVTDKKMWTLFCKYVDGCNTLADRPWETYRGVGSSDLEWVKQEPSKIQWLIANNHSALLRYEKASATYSLTENAENSLLLRSSRRGQISFVEVLLNNTRSRHKGLDQAIPAAAEGGHLEVVERLLAANADVNAATGSNGRTALQAAAEGGHLEVVERLLAANADVNAAAAGGYNGRTALQAAAGGGYLEVVERLLAANANINAQYNGQTALQAAAQGGHLEMVERLLAANADVNAATGSNGRTALQAAAEGGHLEVVERLLAANADVNTAAAAAESDGRTALQAAAQGGHLEVVERLLAASADVNAAAGSNGRTALQAAAQGGHLKVVERLLAAYADVNAAAAGSNGRTALQAAAEGGHLEVVERLLAANADVNATAAWFNGRTALQAAAQGGHLEVVERLLAANADVNAAAAGSDGRTALQAAAEDGHLEVVERLLAANADINATAAWYKGRTALQAAAQGGHLEMVERLLAANANVNAAAAGSYGRTALQAAAEGGHLETVERLLAANADVNATAAWYNGRTALQAAAQGGHLEMVERLLAANADVNAAAVGGSNGRTALQAAAEGGHLEVVERLLTANADVNAAADEYDGRTALQAAAQGGHLEVVERLLTANADVNAAASYNGRTALQAAAEGGHLEVMEKLLAANADINAAAAGFDGRTALQAAAQGGHLEMVERLLTANADVNATAAWYNGRTALQAAADGGHLEVVERLNLAGARTL